MAISNTEYWAQVRETAGSVIEAAREYCCEYEGDERTEGSNESLEEHINDSLLHETIDGHEWIIYYSYNLDILQHSSNDDYMIDELGDDTAGQRFTL